MLTHRARGKKGVRKKRVDSSEKHIFSLRSCILVRIKTVHKNRVVKYGGRLFAEIGKHNTKWSFELELSANRRSALFYLQL